MTEKSATPPVGTDAPGESAPSPTQVRRPLWAKLAIGAGVLATLPVTLVGLLLIDVNEDALRTSTRELHLSVTEDVSETISRALVESHNGLDGVARALTRGDVEPETRLQLALTQVDSNEAIDHAIIYDREGNKVDVIREKSVEFDPAPTLDKALMQRAAAQKAAVGEVRPMLGGMRVQTLVPMVAKGKLTGFVVSWVELERVQKRVEFLSVQRFAEQPNALFVLDQDHHLVAHPDRKRVEAREVIGGQLLEQVTPQVIKNHVVINGDFEAPDGEEMLGAVKPLEHTPWLVVVQVPRAVAYASVYEMRRIVYVATALAVVLALLAALLFSLSLTAPITSLVAFAGHLSRREFGARLSIGTSDELALLGSAMSQAANDLETSEEALKQEVAIRTDLGRYLPRELVEGVVRREHDMMLGGSRRQITVIFADVVSFTPLTEKLAPEDVVTVLNQLFTILTEIVFRHEGTVDKFVGDCVMAFWGAPTTREDHAELALAAAEDMLRFLEVGNAEWNDKYGITIQLAIGVNSGEAVVGNIGSETRMEYTAIGDVVNVAARLEAIANPQQILITNATRQLAGDAFDYVSFGARDISGRVEDVQLFEVVL